MLPASAADWLYDHGIVRSDVLRILAKWVLPAIILVMSFVLLKDWLKALVAGAISCFVNVILLGVGQIFALDCAPDVAGVKLSQACYGDPSVIYAFKFGIAAMLSFNIFLLYRLASVKTSKTDQGTK